MLKPERRLEMRRIEKLLMRSKLRNRRVLSLKMLRTSINELSRRPTPLRLN